MSEYILGIDGGGTKTNICIQNADTDETFYYMGGELNCNGNSIHTVSRNLSEITEKLAAFQVRLNQISAVCIGIAGYSNSDTNQFLRDYFKGQGFCGHLILTGDCQTALSGALDGDCGAVIISGTGSVCYGRSDTDEVHQCGGGGYLFDDGGSGYQIGLSILKYAIKAMDGRIPSNIFLELLKDQYHISTREQLIHNIYSAPSLKKTVASYAPLLLDAYNDDSPLAHSLMADMAAQLADISIPVIGRLRLYDNTMAVCGSIFQYYPPIHQQFCTLLNTLFPKLTIISPIHDAAYGAVLIAKKSR